MLLPETITCRVESMTVLCPLEPRYELTKHISIATSITVLAVNPPTLLC